MSKEFVNRFNNYDCILKNDCKSRSELSHYTDSSDAVINISKGCFWATDLPDFDDKLEGKLIFKRINEILSGKDIVGITPEHIDYIEKNIGDDDKINTLNMLLTLFPYAIIQILVICGINMQKMMAIILFLINPN